MVAVFACFAYNTSEVCLKGDWMSEVPALLKRHGDRIVSTAAASTWQARSQIERRNTTSLHATSVFVYLADGWTHLCDERLELPKDEKLWTAWTKAHDARPWAGS